MRRTILATAATLAVLTGAAMAPASAMTVTTPAGIQTAVEELNVTNDVAYVCRRVWSPYGWRRSCYWTGGRGYYRGRRYGRGYRRW